MGMGVITFDSAMAVAMILGSSGRLFSMVAIAFDATVRVAVPAVVSVAVPAVMRVAVAFPVLVLAAGSMDVPELQFFEILTAFLHDKVFRRRFLSTTEQIGKAGKLSAVPLSTALEGAPRLGRCIADDVGRRGGDQVL